MRKCRIVLVALSYIVFVAISSSGAQSLRIGIPADYRCPIYQQLFSALSVKGLVEGENLQIVPIDLSGHQDKASKKEISQKIADQTDLFFTTGEHQPILFNLSLSTPLLFAGVKLPDPEILEPKNSTGIYWGSLDSVLSQLISYVPFEKKEKVGLLYCKGSQVDTMRDHFVASGKRLGVTIDLREYRGVDDVKRVMHVFKNKGIETVFLWPSAAHNDEVDEIVKWQFELNLPVIGQVKSHIEQGLLGGPVVEYGVLLPMLTEYVDKIYRGRNAGQLPVKYIGRKDILNLSTVSKLGYKVPQEVVNHAEIIGLATSAPVEKKVKRALVPGSYRLGVSQKTPNSFESLLKALELRGYVQGENLSVVEFNFRAKGDFDKQKKIANELAEKVDAVYATGNALSSLVELPALQTPVCFISTKETASIIPKGKEKYFTGVIRASFGSIVQKAQRLMGGARSMGLLARLNSNLGKSKDRYTRIAEQYGVDIVYKTFKDVDEVGFVMQEFKKEVDFILLFPPSISKDDLSEIVMWQNKLKLPVLAQLRKRARAGLLGGMVIDLEKTMPKVAEYLDKIMQGRSPAKLPVYFYPEKFVINLRAASALQIDLPDDITNEAEIVR